MDSKPAEAGQSVELADFRAAKDSRPVPARLVSFSRQFFRETVPAWLTVGVMLALIFGGCCSNVYALEAIVKVEPASGTLLTFVQFLFVAVTGWLVNIILFFSINVLNNHAFSYNISVPVHIILRSGGSITTMIAGKLYGKKYSRIQVIAVFLLTIGVVTAAWSDAQSKGTVSEDEEQGDSSFVTGLSILFTAQVLSAIMGLYTEETYRHYGSHWKENLFYSHLISLPLFLPFLPSLTRQFARLAESPPLSMPYGSSINFSNLPDTVQNSIARLYISSQLAYLALNVLTQYACIRGVNLLAAVSSALTVTIVLNVRKLVSLLLSIWLFGNRLAFGTLVGACVVFFAGGLYSLDGKRGGGAKMARVEAQPVPGKIEARGERETR